MPRAMYTIYSYIVEVRKKDTVYMVFHELYNKVYCLRQYDLIKHPFDLIDEKYVDWKTRERFLEFCKKEDIETVEVMDWFDGMWFLVYPYLGTLALNIEIGSRKYERFKEKWGDPYGVDLIAGTTLPWVMPYEAALKIYEKEKEDLEKEFGEEESWQS